jgi:hypothetical protein
MAGAKSVGSMRACARVKAWACWLRAQFQGCSSACRLRSRPGCRSALSGSLNKPQPLEPSAVSQSLAAAALR